MRRSGSVPLRGVIDRWANSDTGFAVSALVASAVLGSLGAAFETVSANRYLEEGLFGLALRRSAGISTLAVVLVVSLVLVVVGAAQVVSRLAALVRRRFGPKKTNAVGVLISVVAAAAAVAVLQGRGLVRIRQSRLGTWLIAQEVDLAVLFYATFGGLLFIALLDRLARGSQLSVASWRRWVARATLPCGLLWTGLQIGSCGAASGAADSAPNLVLITVDSLRADHLSCYGHPHATTPAVDRLAAGGIRFGRAMAPAPWTLPSMASLQTGRYPSEHGAERFGTKLGRHNTTLAEILADGGYETAGVVSHVFVSRSYGLAQGFEHFDDTTILAADGLSSRLLTEKASALLDRLSEPYYLWVHYFDPHYTYVQHDEFDFSSGAVASVPAAVTGAFLDDQALELPEEAVREIRSIYDEEIAFTDRAIGDLLERVQGGARRERPTLIAITADHGEHFRERGHFGHGEDLYQEVLHVPLVLGGSYLGGARGQIVDRPVAMLDLGHTLAAAAKVDPARFRGRDLLGALSDRPDPFLAELRRNDDGSRLTAAYAGSMKLIHDTGVEAYELFDLATDPGEQHDLWSETRADDPVIASLVRAIQAHESRAPARVTERALTNSELEHLEALGYVN